MLKTIEKAEKRPNYLQDLTPEGTQKAHATLQIKSIFNFLIKGSNYLCRHQVVSTVLENNNGLWQTML